MRLAHLVAEEVCDSQEEDCKVDEEEEAEEGEGGAQCQECDYRGEDEPALVLY